MRMESSALIDANVTLRNRVEQLEKALRFYRDQHHYRIDGGKTRIVDIGGVAQTALDDGMVELDEAIAEALYEADHPPMLISPEWLKKRIESDPDCEVEAGILHPEAPCCATCNGDGYICTGDIDNQGFDDCPECKHGAPNNYTNGDANGLPK